MSKNFRNFFLGIIISTLLCIISWILIIFKTSPEWGEKIIIFFYLSLFLSSWGILTIFIFYLRLKLSRNELIYSHFPIAVRQSFLLTLIIITLLLAQSFRVLNLLLAILIIIIISSLELFFRTKKSKIK